MLVVEVISPFVEWTIPAGRADICCSVSPRATCNSNEMNDCIRPKLQRSPVCRSNPSYFQLGIGDKHL